MSDMLNYTNIDQSLQYYSYYTTQCVHLLVVHGAAMTSSLGKMKICSNVRKTEMDIK